jgi:hypothetical protein
MKELVYLKMRKDDKRRSRGGDISLVIGMRRKHGGQIAMSTICPPAIKASAAAE